jgi:hypothetical protein
VTKATIFMEGGGDSKELRIRCRLGFQKLLKRCGFVGRMPHLVARGPRSAAYQSFVRAHKNAKTGTFIALLVDSEDPVADVESPWAHLFARDSWTKPHGAEDDQVLLMTTCMETWIVSDQETLRAHYGSRLQESALPSLVDLEFRSRGSVQNALAHATRKCSNHYQKGKRSFTILGKLIPNTLVTHLPSFTRARRILEGKLYGPTTKATTHASSQ